MFRAPEMIERRLIRIGRFEVRYRRDISRAGWFDNSWLVFIRRQELRQKPKAPPPPLGRWGRIV